jgi:transposase
VRDGYAGYSHLTDAAHAWCGAHLLRELKDLYEFEPAAQTWAKDMAGLLCEANHAAHAARAEGRTVLEEDVLAGLVARYRALTSEGSTANYYRRTPTATKPGTVEFTNNVAEGSMPRSKSAFRHTE